MPLLLSYGPKVRKTGKSQLLSSGIEVFFSIYFNAFSFLKGTQVTYEENIYKQYNNKQLLDEVEHDIMNYQNRCLCYLPKAEADNTDTRF